MSGGGISTRQATRGVARQALHDRRRQTLPVTWLGTGGHARPEDDGWKDHMISRPLFAAGGVALAGILMDQALGAGMVDPVGFIPPGGVAGTTSVAVGALGGLVGLVVTAGHRFTDWARAYMTAGPVAAGVWLAGVAATSPFNLPMLAAAAAGTWAAAAGYRRMIDEQDRYEQAFVARFAPPAAGGDGQPPAPPSVVEDISPEAREWNEAFDDVGLKGCRYRKREETPAGFAVLVRFPKTGTIGMREVDGKLEALERSLHMLKDCLEVDVALDPVTGRELSDRCWIHVDVRDILAQTLDMPEDHSPTSINEAFQIGEFIDGTPITLRLREISALIVGIRGRGKTNLFHVIVHALSRCVDVVLWAMDLKGGRAVKPWLAPWLEGKAARPIFDWVATTRAEGNLMLRAAKALIEYRGVRSRGGSKIEPSESHPAVLVICDEIAALVGRHSGPARSVDWRDPTPGQVAAVLTSCVQLGRSEAVDFVLCSQRGTVTMVGGGDLKSQCEMRIGLGVTNPSDATSVFQNSTIHARKLRRLKYKRTRGACLIENGDDSNHLVGKIFFYGDDKELLVRCARAAIAHANYPADLPTDEQQVIEDALRIVTAPRDKRGNVTGEGEYGYGVGPDGAAAERWSAERAAHLYRDDLPDAWVDDEDDTGETLAAGPPAPPGRGGTATAVRPAATPAQRTAPADEATPDSSPADGGTRPLGTGRTYYVRRRDRNPDQPHQPPAAAADPIDQAADEMFAGLDEGFKAWLDSLPETEENGDAPPAADEEPPGELSRYDLMVQLIRDAGGRGTVPSEVAAEMRRRGRFWSARTDIYPALRRALDAGVIVQPAGKGGRYYHRDHTPTRPE